MLTDEMRYKLMRALQEKPETNQRELACALAVSLGKVNYCLQALIECGLVKTRRFKNSQNKTAYVYLLTARGIEQKARLTVRFLHAKMEEYEALWTQVEQIQREANAGEPLLPRRLVSTSK